MAPEIEPDNSARDCSSVTTPLGTVTGLRDQFLRIIGRGSLGYYIPGSGRVRRSVLIGAAYQNSTVVEYGSFDNRRQIIYERAA
jgi:hypothetical protein